MKFKLPLALIVFLTTVLVSSNGLAEPIVVLSENKADYQQTADGYILHFTLDATANELEIIRSYVEPLSDRVTMTTELISEGHYKCVYTVAHQNQPEYVHKMMLSSGFKVISYQGKSYGLNKLTEVLYSFQEEEK